MPSRHFMIDSGKHYSSTRKYGIMALKFLVVIIIGILLYRQVFYKKNVDELYATFSDQFTSSGAVYLLIPFFVLMIINWMLEAKRWQIITSYFKKYNLYDCLKMVIVGITFGVVTPSRIGEYGGRFYMMEPDHRWKAISGTLVGSIAQNIVTAMMGLLGAWYLYAYGSEIAAYITGSLFAIGIVGMLIGLYVYFNISGLERIINWLPEKINKEKWRNQIHFLVDLRRRDQWRILAISVLRYLTYFTQYYLLIRFFGIDVSMLMALAIIALILLIQSGLPLPPIIGFVARGEVALFLWGEITENALAILATTYGLWLINLVFPALCGLLLVLLHRD